MKIIDETFDNEKEKNIDLNFENVVNFEDVAHKVAGIDEAVDNMILKADFQQILNKLSPLEKKVVTLRYGLDDNNPKTYKEIGKELGYCTGYMRSVDLMSVRKLKYMCLFYGLEGKCMNVSEITKKLESSESTTKYYLKKCNIKYEKTK